ncbi:Replication termination factor 2 [Cyphellophora attinorum]|uniref:Replication termination factor 2 n=1 Tax=Cyphellophora attinorum TaxID=1664694 RepID=A0A0N0NPQ2_9EURO|nr:Replication termination factor 2 [Phialophora attinorum]KPI42809.1 Replication termination factor 2 [Phialophora attinorum]
MGNDGGSIPTRRELVKTAATNPSTTDLKEKQREHLAHRWSQCPLSHRALVPPIVSDHTGDLYNKDAVLQFLLPEEVGGLGREEREGYEAWLRGRVKGLKDVVELKFQVEGGDEAEKKGGDEKWVCPITGKELGVGVKSVYVVPCGHAFSAEAVREVGKAGTKGECSVCGQGYEVERDVVPILPSSEEDKEFVRRRMEGLREKGLSHSLKKDKGGKKRKKGVEESEKEQIGEKTTKVDGTATKTSNGIKNSATASLAKKVLEEEEAKKKRRLDNENISSLYAKKTSGLDKQKDGNFMTRGFSVK